MRFDFENGSLQGWEVVEGAFEKVVTDRANEYNTRRPQAKSGTWFLSTLESFSGKPEAGPTGVVESPTVRIDGREVAFWIGGGKRGVHFALIDRETGREIARATGLERLRPVAVMRTGVTGQTGIETGEYLLSIVKRIRPNAVIAIDALASRRLERLGCTLQISDTGISPGAGVGNHRTRINHETLGVPVIAIGVPTVVDVQTLANDLLGSDFKSDTIARLAPKGRRMVVIPDEIDLLTERAARLIGFSLNAAMQNDFELSDLVALM